jgi:hypothetical protein
MDVHNILKEMRARLNYFKKRGKYIVKQNIKVGNQILCPINIIKSGDLDHPTDILGPNL